MKILSVIIPLYNSAQWLEKCLDSVINQDIPADQMEIICINDGSPDNSAEIARGMSEELRGKNGYSPIIVIDQENQGPSGARNTGMKAATGKYLMFVDPDDYVEPNTFGGLVKQMEDEQLDMLRFNYQIVDENYQPVEKRAFEKAFDYTPCLMSGAEFLANRLDIACNIWRYIYRTEIITKNEIWCYTGDYYDDTPWLPLVLMKAERMNVCDTIVYDYFERQDGLVRVQSPKMLKRKIDGALMLLSLLKNQQDMLSVLLPNKHTDETIYKVRRWYLNMVTHIYISALTRIAVSFYSQRNEYLHQLNQFVNFPLQADKLDTKMQRKLRLINISPKLFMTLVQIKSKI